MRGKDTQENPCIPSLVGMATLLSPVVHSDDLDKMINSIEKMINDEVDRRVEKRLAEDEVKRSWVSRFFNS